MFKKIIPIFLALFFLAQAAVCYAGPQATIMLTVTVGNALISNVSDAPDAFSPNADGNYDNAVISYQLNTNTNISVIISDQFDNQVRVLKNNISETPGLQSAVWDGRDSSGNIVPDGTYTYAIISPTETKSGQITVDNKFLDLVLPEDNSIVTIGGQLVFYAIPSQYTTNTSNLKLFYRHKGTQDWIDPGAVFEHHANGNWILVDDSATGNDGEIDEVKIFAQYQDLNGQTRQEYTVPITLTFSNEFNIFSIYSSPNAFSPNGDGDFDTGAIYFSINRNALLSLKIYDKNNNLIRTMGENISATPDDIEVPWDGRDDSSNLQPDGEYIYRITADDGQGNVLEKQGSITIDNHFMTITEPAQGTTLGGQVTFKAIKSENVFQETNVLFYSRQKGTSDWESIDDSHPPLKQPDGSWAQTVDTSQGALNAIYEIRVGGDYYSQDNQLRREYSLPIEYPIINNLHIINSEISTNPFSPNADGQYDTTQIEYQINASAEVTIKIFDSAHSIVRTIQDNASMPLGSNSAIWDGSDDSSNPVPEGIYTYEITAEDAQHTISDTASGTVLIDNHFMRITSPAVGSNLTKDVTLIAVPSVNTQNINNVAFSYRAQGAQTWTNTPAAQIQGNGSWTVDWNVDSLSSGDYEVRVFADYNDLEGGNRSEYSVANSYLIPDYVRITDVSDAPDAFSPNNDQQFDENTLSYDISRDSTVSVKVYDENDNLIRILKDNILETTGTQTGVWDGKNDLGAIVSDGEYHYLIEATDTDNYQAQYQESVAVDNTIIIFDPASGSNVSGQQIITISPSPYISIQDVIFYYRLPGTVYWSNFGHGTNQGDGTWDVTWDTSGLENADYEIKTSLNCYDRDNNFRQEEVLAGTYSLANGINIFNVSDAPDAFSPNNDGDFDEATISYKIVNNDGLVTIKLYDDSDNLVKTLKDGVLETQGDYQVVWDGKNDSDQILAEGTYTYIIEIDDGQGNIVEKQGTSSIDNNYLTITSPVHGSMIEQTVTLTAVPSQSVTLINSVYFYYRLSSEQIWRSIGSTTKQPDDSFILDWDISLFENEDVEVRARAGYRDLNNQSRVEYTQPSTYTINNAIDIFNVADAPDAFSPNNDGSFDVSTISYRIVNADATVTITVYDALDNLVKTLKDGVLEVIGDYEVDWDGKNETDQTLADGVYTYIIEADDGHGNTAQKQGTITVDNHFLTITQPVQGSSIDQIVTFTAVPSQFVDSMDAVGFYYQLSSESGWQYIGPGVEQLDDSFTLDWDVSVFENEEVDVRGRANYRDLNNQGRGEYTLPLTYTINNAINIFDVSDSPDAFSPNGDGQYDTSTISYKLVNADGYVTVKLYNELNNVVKTFKDGVLEQRGDYQIVWDGKNDSDQLLTEGVYTYIIDVYDGQGNTAQKQGTITIDNNSLTITDPAQGSMINQTVTFTAVSSEFITLMNSVQFYYRLSSDQVWQYIGYGSKQLDDSFMLDWDTTLFENQEVDVRVRANYNDLNNTNRSEDILPLTYTINNSINISNVTDAPDAFSPNGDGQYDTSTISYKLVNVDGYVTVKLYDGLNNVVKTFKEGVLEQRGDYKIVWDGKNESDQLLTEGVYTYIIDLDDGQGNAVQEQGTITIDNNSLTITDPAQGSMINQTVTFTAVSSEFITLMNSVQFYYRLSSDQVWQYIGYGSKQLDGSFILDWDTTLFENEEVDVRARVNYTDLNNLSRNEYVQSVAYTINNPINIFNVTVSPEVFSPNGDGRYDSAVVDYKINDPAFVSVRIYDLNNTLVRTLKENVSELKGANTATWDGMNDSAAVMPDGIYTYKIDAQDSELNQAQQRVGTVTIDVTAPVAIITQPVNDEILWNVVSIEGTVGDDNFNQYQLRYGVGETPMSWTTIFSSTLEKTNEKLADWDTSLLENNSYMLKLTVEDTAGNIYDDSVTITLDNIQLTDVTVDPTAFCPNEGQISDINFSLNKNSLISVGIYSEISKTLVKNLLNDQQYAAGTYSLEWDGRNNNSEILPSEAYYFVISAEDTSGRIAKYNDPVSPVTVNSQNLGDGHIIPEDFNPYKNETAQIIYSISAPARMQVLVRSVSGTQVRTLASFAPRLGGTNTEMWDGRDDNGDIINGQYKLYFNYPRLLPRDLIILQGSSFDITNIKTEAYLIIPANSQISTIYYELTDDSIVSVEIEDPNGNFFTTLISNLAQNAGSHNIEWDGTDAGGNLCFIEGDYRVRITAADPNSNYEITKIATILVYKD